MRKIGDQVLRHAGDPHARILPIEETRRHTYLISFSAPFTFVPDSLVAVIGRVVKNSPLPPSYLVEVVSCTVDKVIFGYSIDPDSTRSVVACLGRPQEKACYRIRLTFQEEGVKASYPNLLTGSLIALLLLLTIRLRYLRRRPAAAAVAKVPETIAVAERQHDQPAAPPTPPTPPAPSGIAIGRFVFLKDSQLLLLDAQKIPLTAKEASLLYIFATAQNEVVDRERLMKEVWEDEGVIVGRSLDMFVSKLRKKLQPDAQLAILNVHGKGYKLVVDMPG